MSEGYLNTDVCKMKVNMDATSCMYRVCVQHRENSTNCYAPVLSDTGTITVS